MKANDIILYGNSYFVVGKVKDGKFKAHLNGAFFTGSVYDYHFSENLNAWVKNSEPAKVGKISRRKA